MEVDLGTDLDPGRDIGEQQDSSFQRKPGKGMYLLTQFHEWGDTRNGKHIFKYEIVAHEEPGEVANLYWDRISDLGGLEGKQRNAVAANYVNLAIAFGLYTAEQLKQMKAKGEKPNFDFGQCVGRAICINTYASKDTDAQGNPFLNSGAYFHPGDPKAAKYPKHPQWTPKGAKQPTAPATSPPAEQKPQEPTAATAEGAAANPFAGRV